MSLSTYSNLDIVRADGSHYVPHPGDLVQHVNDHESLGTAVAWTGHGYTVIWSRPPRMSRAVIAETQVRRTVAGVANNFIGSPNDERARRALQHAIHAGMAQLQAAGILDKFIMDVESSPTDRRLSAKISYTLPGPIQTHTLVVTLA